MMMYYLVIDRCRNVSEQRSLTDIRPSAAGTSPFNVFEFVVIFIITFHRSLCQVEFSIRHTGVASR